MPRESAAAASAERHAARIAFVALVFASALVRSYGVLRPLDRVSSWHEYDAAAMARSYHEEGTSLLYPRIDWRGDGPGYVEAELPIVSWCMALGYRLLGEHAAVGRVLTYAVALLTLVPLYLLARRLLSTLGALVACAFYAFQPLVVQHSTMPQPESWMLLFYVSSAYFFWRWLEEGSLGHYAAAVACTSAAILSKAPAAHIGILFGILVLRTRGGRALRDPLIWGFAAGALLPAIVWYAHAHRLYVVYGNSLGISDESHWASWDLFTNPYFVKGILRNEIQHVWISWGGLVVAVAAFLPPVNKRLLGFVLPWYAAIAAYYLVAARTTADDWAGYYHIVSVPVAALLIGGGVDSLRRVPAGLYARLRTLAVLIALTLTVVSLGTKSAEVLWRQAQPSPLYACTRVLAPSLSRKGLIVASGSTQFDPTGRPVAYHVPYAFYWLHRKGFVISQEGQSIRRLESFARRGAQYFVANTGDLARKPGFRPQVEHTFLQVGECGEVVVFDLQ